jgi:hypothetical protein
MIDKHYRESALKTYGEACEICGHRTSLEVHHIDYQEHQVMENNLRTADKMKSTLIETLLKSAKDKGYDGFKDGQLSKNDDTENTSVLCGNCHSFLHLVDYGKLLLKAIKPRIKGGNIK